MQSGNDIILKSIGFTYHHQAPWAGQPQAARGHNSYDQPGLLYAGLKKNQTVLLRFTSKFYFPSPFCFPRTPTTGKSRQPSSPRGSWRRRTAGPGSSSRRSASSPTALAGGSVLASLWPRTPFAYSLPPWSSTSGIANPSPSHCNPFQGSRIQWVIRLRTQEISLKHRQSSQTPFMWIWSW